MRFLSFVILLQRCSSSEDITSDIEQPAPWDEVLQTELEHPSVGKLWQETRRYMIDIVNKDDQYATVRDKCLNTHEGCTVWAFKGECSKNINYMHKHCAPACQSCLHLDRDNRCPPFREEPGIFGSGDLNRMYERTNVRQGTLLSSCPRHTVQ